MGKHDKQLFDKLNMTKKTSKEAKKKTQNSQKVQILGTFERFQTWKLLPMSYSSGLDNTNM